MEFKLIEIISIFALLVISFLFGVSITKQYYERKITDLRIETGTVKSAEKLDDYIITHKYASSTWLWVK